MYAIVQTRGRQIRVTPGAIIEIDGTPTPAETVMDRGRPVTSTAVLLERGQSVEVRWTARSGEGQDGPVRVRTSPGMEQEPAVTTAASACGAD